MKNYFITGGCGFIGCNAARSLLDDGHRVTVFDNLSRKGTERNLEWLRSLNHQAFTYVEGDIRNYDSIRNAITAESFDSIYHFAGQVAVTTSVVDPRSDFEINALGTFNVLEAVREAGLKIPFFFTSTNKVYGGMEDVNIVERNGRYEYENLQMGVPEDRLLDFHSPYGCSKGAADQYVRDYGRIYGIPTVVFRMSCQYGPRQFGNEDQGWVAHFLIAAHQGKPISIYGDGKQVRDLLFVEDLVRAFRMAQQNLKRTSGNVYNIGGGPSNTMSLLELITHIENLTGKKIDLSFGDWRPGDQPVYVSDIRKAEADFGWKPTTDQYAGVERLLKWVRENSQIFG